MHPLDQQLAGLFTKTLSIAQFVWLQNKFHVVPHVLLEGGCEKNKSNT